MENTLAHSHETLKVSKCPDTNHLPKTICVGISAFLIMVSAAGIGYVWGLNNKQESSSQISYQIKKPSPSPVPTQTVDTSNWKTYRSSKYGFEFKYPFSFGNLTEDGLYLRFSENKNFYLYLSSEPVKNINPNQTKDQCGTFLYCRYVTSADNKWIFIREQNSFQDEHRIFALHALTEPLSKTRYPDYTYAIYLNFFLEFPEVVFINNGDTITRITKESFSTETTLKIDEFDQILATFRFAP